MNAKHISIMMVIAIVFIIIIIALTTKNVNSEEKWDRYYERVTLMDNDGVVHICKKARIKFRTPSNPPIAQCMYPNNAVWEFIGYFKISDIYPDIDENGIPIDEDKRDGTYGAD
jgi:hypothetical protein